MGSLVLVFLASAALGSVPVAWLLVRLHSRQDVGASGSGNVGALNALRVSRSPWVGVAVGLCDAAKGALAAWLAPRAGGAEALALQAAACVGVVAGHNYNLPLSLAAGRLRGGKGFAAAGGALAVTAPWLLAVWSGVLVLAWIGLRAWRGIRDEAPASAAATLALVPGAAWLYTAPVVLAAVGLVLLVAPKLVREVRTLLAPPRPPAAPSP